MLYAKKVLVIDDDAYLRDSILAALTDWNMQAYAAEGGREGIELYESLKPDLALIDLSMPDLHGSEVIRQLKKLDPDFPMIVISGNGMIKEAVEAIRLGAWDYIIKPIKDFSILQHCLTKAFERTYLIKENKRNSEALLTKNEQLAATNTKLLDTLHKLQEGEEAAKKIQFQFLPANNKRIASYKLSRYLLPSLHVSGDFVDYFKIDDEHFGFYIADVSGHGVSSAFVTVMLKLLVQQKLERFKSGSDSTVLYPEEMLSELNEEIIRENLEKHLTIFYGVINNSKNVLYFANGGHFPYPILSSGNRISFIKANGMLVGVIKEVAYEVHCLPLPPTFKLILFSDGVLDLLADGELSEKQNKLLSLCAGKSIDIAYFLKTFETELEREFPDDITFLIIEKTE